MARKYVLQPGDILLFKPRPSDSIVDKFIVWGQRFFRIIPKSIGYCHVSMVDLDTRYMLEAKWPKTRRSSIVEQRATGKEKIEVYRIRNITPEQVAKILKYAHDHLNEWYDVPLFLTGFLKVKHTQICSTYICDSCKAADLDVPIGCQNLKFVVPDDFYLDKITLERII